MKKWCLKHPIDIGNQKGFTLIELVVVLAVLTILSGLGFFAFLKFIDDAKLAATKHTLANNYKECKANKGLRTVNIPGVVFTNFENSDKPDCSNDTIAANVNEVCCLTISPSTGEKNFGANWPKNYDSCNGCNELKAQANPHPEGPECNWDWVMAAYHDSNPPPLNCGTYGHRQCLPETCSYKFVKQDDQWWLDNNHPIKLVFMDEKGGDCKKEQFKMNSVGGNPKMDWPGAKAGCELNIPYINQPGYGNPDYDRFVTWQNNGGELGKSYKNNFNKSPQTEYNGATLINLFN